VTDTPEYERLEGADCAGAEESVRDLLALPDPPSEIIAGNNRASSGVTRALGYPFDHLAFIGFDDFELADGAGISVIAYDPAELGRRAARLAIARLDDPVCPSHRLEIPTTLNERGSGERDAAL